MQTVLVTGGGGYVGSALVPRLLDQGHIVRVIDLFLYGRDVLESVQDHPHLEIFQGDIRDSTLLNQIIPGCDAVIHLACVSNDPSFELDPQLGKSINYDAFLELTRISKQNAVKRFVYASSSSVYGIKENPNVTEELPLDPLTDYSKYKALCEEVLFDMKSDDFCVLIARPATVCGYSPRLRLDLTVNILSNHALTNKKITVFGGTQLRPNIHIQDMVDFYIQTLRWDSKLINGKTYNVGYENHSVREIADIVREVIDPNIEVVATPSDDLRSYHICSKKIERELGFAAKRTLRDAVSDLREAFLAGKVPDSMTDPRYYNIRTMQQIDLPRTFGHA